MRLFCIALVMFFGELLVSQPAQAELPSRFEPAYSEALLQYHAGQYSQALKALDALQKAAPEVPEILELRILILKVIAPEKTAIVYQELIAMKTRQKKSRREIAPYVFELGVKKLEEKDYKSAWSNFVQSYQAGFNMGASRFFLGMIAYQKQLWKVAEEQFLAAAESEAIALRAPSQFYLGQIAFRNQEQASGIEHLVLAREAAAGTLNNPNTTEDNRKMAKPIWDACDKIIKPLDRSRFSGSLGLNFGYDSNVLTLPETVSGSSASGKSTVKGVFSAGGAYSTTPIRTWQWIPSYRLLYNYNFNRDSRTAEYLIQTLSLYVNHHPMSPSTWGMKFEAAHSFQNTVDAEDDSSTYRPLSLNFSTGPYFRKQLAKNVVWNSEFLFEPQKYYTDKSQTPNNKLSGTQFQGKTSVNWDRNLRFYNPLVSFGLLHNDTDGIDYNSWAASLGLGNTSHLGPKWRVFTILEFAATTFGDHSGMPRNDKTLNGGITASYQMNPTLSWTTDFRATKNSSNLPEQFSYTRLVFTSGLTAQF
jgi:hypothetical protein